MKESEIRNANAHIRYLEMVREDALAYFGNPERLEEVDCPACASSEWQTEFEKFGFAYVSCSQCRTLYVNPRPKLDFLKNFYVESPSSRYWIDEFFKPVAEARREKIFRPRARFLADLMPEPTGQMIGDIGAGFGIFLEELRKSWPSVCPVAIEPSSEMAQICRQNGLRVEESLIEEMDGYTASFSVLTVFELLEHLHRPRCLVQKAFELLKPGGYLLLTTLNGEGFDIQVLWSKSRTVFPPHHLNFLNPGSLQLLCSNAGFEQIAVETPGELDWDIVEGAIQRKEASLERYWNWLAQFGTKTAKAELQQWLVRNRMSSHMRLLARKPLA